MEVTRTQSHCARIARRNPRTQCDADRRDAVAFDVFTLDSIAGRLHRLLLYYLLIIIQCHLRFRSLYGLFYNLFTFYFFFKCNTDKSYKRFTFGAIRFNALSFLWFGLVICGDD